MPVSEIDEILDRLGKSLDKIIEVIDTIDTLVFTIDEKEPLRQQIESIESLVKTIQQSSDIISQEHQVINSILINEINNPYVDELSYLRHRYSEEDDFTPEEVADNLKKYIENPDDDSLLISALKWVNSQLDSEETKE